MTEPNTSHGNHPETRYAGHELARLVSSLKSAPRGSATLVILAGGSTDQKTTTAESIATQLASNLVRVDLGQVVSKFIAETEKNLDRVFAEGARTGAVLLFDESDALFGRRTDMAQASRHSEELEMNQLLPRIDAYSGIVLFSVSDAGRTGAWAARLRHARTVVVDHQSSGR
jgi:SpoVK/Ycf46/Vps4 family AAA+-type ATPase